MVTTTSTRACTHSSSIGRMFIDIAGNGAGIGVFIFLWNGAVIGVFILLRNGASIGLIVVKLQNSNSTVL